MSSSNFPAALDALPNPRPFDRTTVVDHALQHTRANDAIESLQVKVGINGSTDTASLDYRVSGLEVGSIGGTTDIAHGGTGATTAAAARASLYVAAKSSFVVGMNADYVTDGTADTAIIQQGMDAAAAIGGDLVFQQGTYDYDAPLEHKGKVQIRGVGRNAVIFGTTMSSGGIIHVSNRSDLSIEGVTFSLGGGAAAINSYGHTKLDIGKCRFTGTTTSTEGVIFLNGNAASSTMDHTRIWCNDFEDMTSIVRCILLYPRSGHTIDDTKIYGNNFRNTKGPAVYLDDYDVITRTVVTMNSFTNLLSGGTPTTPGVAVFAGLASLNGYIRQLSVTNNQYSSTVTTAGHEQGLVYFYSAKDVVITGNTAVGSWTTSQNTQGPCIAPGRINTPSYGVIIQGNTIRGFDAAWDPDSVIGADVSGNEVIDCGGSFNLGYGMQKYVNIHHNTFRNSPSTNYGGTFLILANTTPVKCSVTDNVYIDDRGSPLVTKCIELTGDFNFSDVDVSRNRFYCPSGTLSFLTKELGSEVQPDTMMDNEMHDSTGKVRENRSKNGYRSNVPTNQWYLQGYDGSTQYFGIQKSSAGHVKIQSYSGTPIVLNPEGNNVGIGANPNFKFDVAGDFGSSTIGGAIRIKEGTNAKMGTATLTAGTVTVSTTAVTASSRIFLTIQSSGGTVGAPYVSARVADTSFTITSTSGSDTSTLAWLIVEPS